MSLLDAGGRPITPKAAPPAQAAGSCPSCGAPAKFIENTGAGFGGHWQKLCNRCGHVLASGQEKVPEGI